MEHIIDCGTKFPTKTSGSLMEPILNFSPPLSPTSSESSYDEPAKKKSAKKNSSSTKKSTSPSKIQKQHKFHVQTVDHFHSFMDGSSEEEGNNRLCNKMKVQTNSVSTVGYTNVVKQGRKIVVKEEAVAKYYSCSQILAARLLGVSVSTLKRRYYQLSQGKKWPSKTLSVKERKKSIYFYLNDEEESEKFIDASSMKQLQLAFASGDAHILHQSGEHSLSSQKEHNAQQHGVVVCGGELQHI